MKKHGQCTRTKKSGAYITYHDMIQRCCNPNQQSFRHYGARGITVCEPWKESFSNFYKDMGDRPDGHSLDRVNNEKGYCPENCRWATHKQQMRNTRKVRYVDLLGTKMSAAEAAEIIGIPSARIYGMVCKYGITHQESVNYFYNKTPRRDVKFIVLNGESMSCRRAEKILKIYRGAINCWSKRRKVSLQEACELMIQKRRVLQ